MPRLNKINNFYLRGGGNTKRVTETKAERVTATKKIATKSCR